MRLVLPTYNVKTGRWGVTEHGRFYPMESEAVARSAAEMMNKFRSSTDNLERKLLMTLSTRKSDVAWRRRVGSR